MKLYEQFLQESTAKRVIDKINREIVEKEIELKTECYQRYMEHKKPTEFANYELCVMRAQLRSMRNGISLSREGMKTCLDKGCKKEIRQYIRKLTDLIIHHGRQYIRRKVVLLL